MIPTVECPKCRNRITSSPVRILSNSVFSIEAYECVVCGNKVKITRYKVGR